MTGTIAIIPARKDSKGVPRKNIKELCNKPLITWTIEAALKSDSVSRVIVSTDCEDIAEISRNHGAEVPFIRPDELATDSSSSMSVVSHMINQLNLKSKNIIFLQPTSPLRTYLHIQEAYKKFIENDLESLVSITPVDKHPYWSYKVVKNKLINFFEEDHSGIRRQDLPEAYALNGAIYIFTQKFFESYNSFVSDESGYYLMDRYSSIDIDDDLDFKIAKLILEQN